MNQPVPGVKTRMVNSDFKFYFGGAIDLNINYKLSAWYRLSQTVFTPRFSSDLHDQICKIGYCYTFENNTFKCGLFSSSTWDLFPSHLQSENCQEVATWELILLTWCWLHSKGLMRMNHSDMKLEIHRTTAPQRNHVAFAAKKKKTIKYYFSLYLFWYQGILSYAINQNHEGEPTLTLSFLRDS